MGDDRRHLFVISGFLITTFLLQESRSTGSISLRKFFSRRAIRLLPTVWLFVTVWLVIGAIGQAVGIKGLTFVEVLKDGAAAVTYVYHVFFPNGLYMIHPGQQDKRTMWHLWTLSVEEHFYLVIPGLVLWCIRRNWIKALGWGMGWVPSPSVSPACSRTPVRRCQPVRRRAFVSPSCNGPTPSCSASRSRSSTRTSPTSRWPGIAARWSSPVGSGSRHVVRRAQPVDRHHREDRPAVLRVPAEQPRRGHPRGDDAPLVLVPVRAQPGCDRVRVADVLAVPVPRQLARPVDVVGTVPLGRPPVLHPLRVARLALCRDTGPD
ncbi:MAG: acyltransferase [Microthrixaceae bacterium]